MLRRLKWFIAGFNQQKTPKTKADAKLLSLPGEHHSSTQSRKSMLEAVHEVAIYIHRFHNLDLFQQGWYQIKITMRWEDSDYASSLGTPSRVVQYDAPDLGSDEALGVWKIDDTDHSFSSQPFRIRYARQDILLSVMISFNLSLGKFKGPITSAVILKFELLYTPVLENGSNMQDSLDASPAAVHEFRIPPKALLGLHSYCPVHFDAFHAVLVDTSVHISLLKGGVHAMKKPSNSHSHEEVTSEKYDKETQVFLVKAFLTSRASLLQELQNLSTAIDQTIELTGFASQHDETKFLAASAEVGMETANGSKIPNGTLDFSSDDLYSLQNDELYRLFHSLGDQMHYLWNTFLNFHRANKTKVLEHLRNSWAIDRRAEWSIWMVYSKVEMPHQSTRSEIDDSLYHGLRGKLPVLRKITEDSSQAAAMRAELHRRSIAQMRINNRSIQDLHIFGDPSRIPIIIVERVVNAPLHSPSGNSYFRNMDPKDTNGMLPEIDSSFSGNQQKGRVLKIAVFVHGFQGHHLDLRLVRNQWLLIDPKIEFLMSEVNEDKTSEDFRDMGLRLAQEVIVFVKKKMDKASRSGGLKNVKLSFVGHSIGNVIIRTALAESIMEPYHRYLNTYISVSGPHLGYLYSSNSLFNSGLWLLKKLKNTRCIHQLTFTDDIDLENTFFYKLSKQKTLESFKNIILLSSPQDGYVPYHSARMEMCQASSADYSKKGKLFLEMLNNCLDQIRSPSSAQRTFMRCDVNFDTSLQGRNLNTMIGRAAHIEFLESDIFAKFIMWSFPELFR
ncbi:protein FAM135B-like isoform X2 [Cynara cardunculus var. scolymus]|uniref:protein FAM135B-like isoform X2 n=1 Tax=Cynara cardunculus var. scolymus TaxID=59895 RepID=UPI000D62CBD5|nr:protein FAM135B-like isoform X2 [Cynara cardunculus var. scolymus]